MDRQLIAKLGVFVLLGVNVGAYYFFWPHENGGAKSEAKAPKEEKGEVLLMPTPPKEFPAKSLVNAIPLSLPVPLKAPESNAAMEDELVARLLSRIKEQTDKSEKPVTVIGPPMPNPFDEKKVLPPETPAAPKFPDDGKPKPLPPLEGNPLTPENVGVTSPLRPKLPPSPWSFKTEVAGNQTLLIAKSQLHEALEFRIWCDRVETKPGGSEVVALGNLLVIGDGLTVRCQRLTLPLHQIGLVFEENVSVSVDKSGLLRGERFLWQVPVDRPSDNGSSFVKPPALGAPK